MMTTTWRRTTEDEDDGNGTRMRGRDATKGDEDEHKAQK